MMIKITDDADPLNLHLLNNVNGKYAQLACSKHAAKKDKLVWGGGENQISSHLARIHYKANKINPLASVCFISIFKYLLKSAPPFLKG